MMKLGYYFCFLTSVCITYGCTNTLKSAQNLKLDLALINLKWTDGFESRDYYWLLERKSDATGVSEITIKNSRYVITPFLLPRFSSELLGCCEFGNINLLDAPSNKNRIDSLNDEYAGYDRLYRGSQLTIGNKYKVSMIKKINNIDCNLSLIKLRATICKCKSSYHYKGSSYTDSIAQIKSMETFIKPNKKEKNGNRYFLSDLFNNVYIKEALPLAKKN